MRLAEEGKRGEFQGSTEPRGPLVEERTRDGLKQSLGWLQRERERVCGVWRSGSGGEKFERAQRGSSARKKVKKRTGRERECQRRKIGTGLKNWDRCVLRGGNNKTRFRAKAKHNVE